MLNVIARCVLTGFLVSLSGTVLSADSAGKCAEIAAPVDRLACYDKVFPPVVKGDVAAVGFGLMAPKKDTKAEPVKVDATITATSMQRDGKRLITLDNGQVWKESEANPMVIINNGMQVVVQDAAMGTYRLIIGGLVGLRVKRVK